MENPENREEKALAGVCPKHFVPWVLTPVMGEFGVIIRGDVIFSLVTRAHC